MIKIISSEEYEKLTRDVDYWETLATTVVKEHVKRVDEYRALNEKYNKLKRVVNNEHQCNRNCFTEHVLPAIQRDCDLTSEKFNFLNYWYEKLSKEYPWLESLYIIDGKIYFNFK